MAETEQEKADREERERKAAADSTTKGHTGAQEEEVWRRTD